MSKIAFLFPGQGSQKPGMVREFYNELNLSMQADLEAAFPGIRQAVESDDKKDTDAMAAQLVYLSGLLSARLLQESGITPDFLAGFSLGEITALAFSEIMPLTEAHRLLAVRSQAMDEACRGLDGAMAAVNGLEASAIDAVLEDFPKAWSVNYNSPKQTVISGERSDVLYATARLKEAGAKVIPLNVKGAFHTPFMRLASDLLAQELDAMEFAGFRYPVLSNLDAAVYGNDPDQIRRRVSQQVVSPVQFTAMIKALYDQGVRVFIETGYGKTLQGLVSRILPDPDIIVGGLSDRTGLGQLKEKLEGITIV